MSLRPSHNPLKVIITLFAIVALVGGYMDPTIRTYLPRWPSATQAVGAYEAVNVLGPDTFTTSVGSELSESRGVEYDSAGERLFVADTSNNRVLVYDLTGGITDGEAPVNVLGQADMSGVDCNRGLVTDIDTLCAPQYVLYDSTANRLFVSDSTNNRIVVFDVTSITDGEDAVSVLGQADFTSGGSGVTQSVFAGDPGGLALSSNTLFVADTSNNRVMVFDVASITNGEDATNVLGQADFTSNTAATTQSGMSFPFDVLIDGASRLFVAEYGNHRVTVFDVASITDGEDAINVLGQADFTSSTATTTQSGMNQPTGLAYDAGNERLFVSGGGNHRITFFSVASITNGEDAEDVLGQTDFVTGTSGVTAAKMDSPFELSFHASEERLFVADSVNNRILVFSFEAAAEAGGGYEATEVFGQPDFETADPLAGDTGMTTPFAVATDTIHNRMFVADFTNNRVLVFNIEAPPTLSDHTADFVLGQPDFDTTAATTTATGLSGPTDVSYDGVNNRLFVADSGNSRILVFNVVSITNGEAAVNVIGQVDFVSSGGGVSDSTLNSPQSISIEPLNGILAVADVGNNRVLVFDVSGGITDGMAAERVFGQPDFDTDTAGLSATEMSTPRGVLAETNTDSLWVVDQLNNRVLQFDLFGASSDPAIRVLGQPDFTSSDSNDGPSGMAEPMRLALKESGAQPLLFVSESDNDRILVFDVTSVTSGEDAIDVYGQVDFFSGDSAVTSSNFTDPAGLDYDEETSALYVADSQAHRVLLFGPVPVDDDDDSSPSSGVEFAPRSIQVNQDDSVTDSRNVLVTVWATNDERFTGTVDVLLSNNPSFSTFVPFRYNIPGPGGEQNIWPKTIAWDLCFGQSENDPCDPGNKTVYARFYVNVPLPSPVLTP